MSDDINEKYRDLVTRLYNKTNSNEIQWEMDWNKEVSCNLANYSVHLRFARDGDGEPLEYLELRNSDDQVIDNFNDSFLNGKKPSVPDVDSYYDLMGRLRQAARRKALGVDEAIDSILGSLE